MKFQYKILLFFCLIALNIIYIQKIVVIPMDIKSFFPKSSKLGYDSSIIKNEKHILFYASKEKQTFDELETLGIVTDVIEISEHNTSMVIFPQIKQAELLDNISSENILGPPVIGQILSKEFISDIRNYVFLVVPFLLLLFIIFTSLRYLFYILLEMLLISFLLLFTISLIPYDMNISFLLSLVFIYIYAFSILNYFYYGEIQKNNIVKGMIISLFTTFLSALFLSLSDFIVISDFGLSLMIWIFILSFYIAFRIYLIESKNWNLSWLNYFSNQIKIEKYIVFIICIIILLAVFLQHKLSINLNPISISSSSKSINDFEHDYILSQPVILSIKSDHCTFKELACINELSVIIEDVISQIPVKAERIIDFNLMYNNFSQSDIKSIDKKKLAQFYLALEFSFNPEYLISADMKETFMLFSISIKESTDALLTLGDKLTQLNKKYPNFSIESLSHLGKIQQYKQMFINETINGIFMMLGLIVFIFMVYYRNFFMLIVFIPAMLTIILFFVLHSLFMIPISLMSLVSLILFIGLIGDNLIHIFICYRLNGILCMTTVYKPIILSNILMVLALFGMIFTGTLLKKFGLELGFLLTVHLFLLVYLMPKLAARYLFEVS